MDYKTIKEKYAPEVKSRRARIRVAEAKVAMYRTAIEQAEAEREKYRKTTPTEVNREKSEIWRQKTDTITKFRAALKEAQTKLAEAELGEGGINTIINNITK